MNITTDNFHIIRDELHKMLQGKKKNNSRQWRRTWARLAPMGFVRIIFGSGNELTRTRMAQLEQLSKELVCLIDTESIYGSGFKHDGLVIEKKKFQCYITFPIPEGEVSLRAQKITARCLLNVLADLNLYREPDWDARILAFAKTLSERKAYKKQVAARLATRLQAFY
ncbi:hypothetical protein [Delftia phage PhiW-14]|uniref:Uncharacterized protein n=1 Tax=Delftia phage PhiW-14 TaxID=665032 RepID=C9DGB9_BPW14|nr:hypothetical protein DP-phiW-14_gp149 [Delftia phage PhiW-14]ACV50170.1 hypothetical protein [Delftia phage PhiW-14]